MKTFFECIAGIALLYGWYLLVSAVFGAVDDGSIGWLVFLFGLPAAALIEKFLIAWQGSGSNRRLR